MIYTIKRNGVVIFTHEIRGSRTQSAPAVDFVDIEFSYYEAILLKKNDTLEFKGQTYYCDKQYNSTQKNAKNEYSIKARFVSENYRATEIAVLDPQGNSTFEIEANLLTLLTLAVTNLNRLSSGWSYNPDVPNTVTKTFEMSEENVMSFLVRMSGEFQIPFDIKDKVISFREPQHEEEGLFKYGRGNGFLDLTKTYRSGERIPNTIYATGLEGLTPEINPIVYQPDIDENGVVEGFYNNENIKPTTRANVTGSTGSSNIFITDIGFPIFNNIIQGQTPLINFETGALGGYSFYLENEQETTEGDIILTIKKRFIDGIQYPNQDSKPSYGDVFNVTNIRQPQEVIDEAKGKLLDYAYDYLDKLINRNLVIKANLDPLFQEDLNLNDKIHIVDEDLNIDGKFIINEIKEDLQNLNKKDISLDFTGFSLYSQTFTLKNENIIDVSFQNINDDLVAVDEEISDVRDRIDITDLEVADIIGVRLPLKEDNINKVDILKITNPTSAQYPTAISVKEALNLKQNKLIQGSNISIVSDTISVPNATSSQAGAVRLFSNTTQTQPANAPTSVPNQTYGVQTNSSGQMVVNVPHVGYSDLDGFVYNVTFDSSTQVLTFFRQNQPNVVVDLPTEKLIKDIEIVTVSGVDYLRLWFQDGTYRDVPLNSLLVGVVKYVNGLIPNSNGEVVVNIGDIPALSSTLSGKANVNGNNLTNITDWRTNLGVYSTAQVDGFLAGKANTSGYYSGFDAGRWNGQNYLGSIGGQVEYFMTYDNVNSVWRPSTIADTQSALGITTALNLNLQQVTNNGASTTHTINVGGVTTASHGTSADWNAKVSQSQLTTALGNKVDKAGDTMSGSLMFIGNEGIRLNSSQWGITYNSNYSGINFVRYGFTDGVFFIHDNENVGVNTINPQYKFDVIGSGRFTDNLIVPNATAPNHAVAFGQLANYALTSQIPTNNNQLANGAGYITAASLPTVNNATLQFLINTAHFSTGAFSFTANQATNVSSTLALSTTIVNRIDLGVSAYNLFTNSIITINGNAQFLSNNPNFTIPATRITGDGDNFVSGDIGVYGEGGTESRQDGTKIYLSQSSFRTEFFVYSNTSATVPNTDTDKVIQKSGSGAITVTLSNGQRNGQKLNIKWGGTSNFTVQGNMYDSGANVSSLTMNSNSLPRLSLIWNSTTGRWWLT